MVKACVRQLSGMAGAIVHVLQVAVRFVEHTGHEGSWRGGHAMALLSSHHAIVTPIIWLSRTKRVIVPSKP